MLILLLPVRNQRMTRILLYLIPGCTCASVKALTSYLSGGRPWRSSMKKEQLATVAWRSYLGVSRSGCAILCLDGEEACRLRIICHIILGGQREIHLYTLIRVLPTLLTDVQHC